MFILDTITHETVWGGTRLTSYSNIKSNKIGHLYSLVSNGDFESKILNGKYKGKLFKEYFDENKFKFKLNEYQNFPFVISLTDATDSLSIQVHPNDNIANELFDSPFGKNESWYFIETADNNKIYNGCKAKSIDELKQKIKENKYDDIIDYLEVKTGDYVYVQAGTLHALSAGSLVYEIEENCNITFRLYDFDRKDKNGKKRPLQIENAIKSVDVNLKSISEEYNSEKQERLYSTKLYKNTTTYKNISSTIECVTILDGYTKMEEYEIKKGITIIIEPNEKIILNNSDFIVARPVIREDI